MEGIFPYGPAVPYLGLTEIPKYVKLAIVGDKILDKMDYDLIKYGNFSDFNARVFIKFM